MDDPETIKEVFTTKCIDYIRLRRECWERSLEGKQGEECIREELREKKCLAINFCPSQATRFYDRRNGECSQWAEAFAFGPNAVQRSVSADKKKIAKCRKITQRLSKCLAKFSLQSSSWREHMPPHTTTTHYPGSVLPSVWCTMHASRMIAWLLITVRTYHTYSIQYIHTWYMILHDTQYRTNNTHTLLHNIIII